MCSDAEIFFFFSLADSGQHDEVTSYLSTVEKTSYYGDRLGDVCAHYSASGDQERSEAVAALLKERGIFPSSSSSLGSLVAAHLGRGDVEAAVKAFEQLAKEERRVPHKFQLMEKLIQVGNGQL